MSGNRTWYGTRRNCTHRPISGRLRISSMTLPTYMLAMTPQKTSGCCVISIGPGCTSWMTSAPSRSAVTALLGMPSDSIGIIAPATAELFADSGPATPSIAPLPNLEGLARGCRSTRVGDERRGHRVASGQHAEPEAEKAAPEDRLPGLDPVVDRGQQIPNLPGNHGLAGAICSMLERISDTPNSPMITATRSKPLVRLTFAEREPLLAVHLVDADLQEQTTPSAITRNPLSIEPCIMNTVATKPSVITAKFSGGPNFSATDVRSGENNVRPTTLKRPGDERSDGRHAERRTGPPLPRHLVAVEARDDRGRLARDVDQDRRGRSPVHGAVEDRRKHGDADDTAEGRMSRAAAPTARPAGRRRAARRPACRRDTRSRSSRGSAASG